MNRSNWLKVSLVAAVGALAMLALPAIAAAKDRNNDRIPDRWEKRHNLSLKVKQTARDQDRDHLRNRQEFLADTDPRDRDSDDDGAIDSEENAGRIQSFDAETGRLVIDLFGDETVSGLVTGETEISCEDEHSATASSEETGDGEPESGDEHPEEEGEEPEGEEHSEEEGEEHEGDDQGCEEHEGSEHCTTADLIPGTIVEEAELKLVHGQMFFEEIELG